MALPGSSVIGLAMKVAATSCLSAASRTVSYTHLDVYKRQVMHVATAPVVLGVLVVIRQGGGHQQLFRAQRVADGLVLGAGTDCLLYTSRCV